jgi:hypothetical protein
LDLQIQIISDTHIEFWKNDSITSIKDLPPPLNDIQPHGKILGLLGDIGCPFPGSNGINLYQQFIEDVRYRMFELICCCAPLSKFIEAKSLKWF